MDKGSYSKKVDFAAFRADRFIAHFPNGVMRCMNGCGSTALSLLTGVSPLSLPRKTDWNRKFMVNFLRSKGFRVAKLTFKNITNCKEVSYPIGGSHVVLARIKFIKNEASWVVIHNGKIYHNFEISDFKGYELINHPVMSMYLIKHRSWDQPQARKENINEIKRLYGIPVSAKPGKSTRQVSKVQDRRSRSKPNLRRSRR